jgi:hypothetical protein
MDPMTETFMGETVLLLVSTGKGRTTCSYYAGDSTRDFVSTLLMPSLSSFRATSCEVRGLIYESFDIFISDMKWNVLKQMTKNPDMMQKLRYHRKEIRSKFTSTRSGDLELGPWISMVKPEASHQRTGMAVPLSPLTKETHLRASRPKT